MDPRPTETLGDVITHWDEFYASHYSFIYEACLKWFGDQDKAEYQTHRIFINLLFKKPEIILEGNQQSFENEVARICPDFYGILRSEKKIQSAALLSKFFCPN